MPLELKYFVLKPRGGDPHARASREAMKAYAHSIREHDPDLYRDLIDWVWVETQEANEHIGPLR